MSAVAPIFGIFFQSEVNPNFGDQLSILSPVAPFFGDFLSRGMLYCFKQCAICLILTLLSGLQLLYAAMNLTTNEMFNYKRYNYLKNSRGKYHNPFSRGILYNLAEFFLCVQPLVEPDDIRLLDLG